MNFKIKASLLALALAGFSTVLLAQVARVERASGDLRVKSGQADAKPLAVGTQLNEGDDIVTERGGTAFLRFSDGQTIAVAENSTLKIAAYKFDQAQAQNSVSSVNLLRGAMRMLTGLIGTRNPASVRITAATATVGIRGTDLIIAVQAGASGAPATVVTQVISGSVQVTTAGGSLVASAGQVVSALGGAAPAASAAGALGGATAGQLGQLQSVNMASGAAAGAGGGAAGAGSATGAATGGISAATIATTAAVAGVVSAIVSAPATGTTGTTAATGTVAR